MDPEKPEADAVEQEREEQLPPDARETPQRLPEDVNPADLAEQERVVADDEDGYDY